MSHAEARRTRREASMTLGYKVTKGDENHEYFQVKEKDVSRGGAQDAERSIHDIMARNKLILTSISQERS